MKARNAAAIQLAISPSASTDPQASVKPKDRASSRPIRPAGAAPGSTDESTDTYDTIAWLLKHLPHHNGKVGQWGLSYDGFYASAGAIDGHPATLAWLGSVHGHRTRSLGVDRFGQTGTIGDLYRHFGIDAQGIVAAAQAVAPGRRIRHLGLAG